MGVALGCGTDHGCSFLESMMSVLVQGFRLPAAECQLTRSFLGFGGVSVIGWGTGWTKFLGITIAFGFGCMLTRRGLPAI
jgi:hypothetical protein